MWRQAISSMSLRREMPRSLRIFTIGSRRMLYSGVCRDLVIAFIFRALELALKSGARGNIEIVARILRKQGTHSWTH